jgi:hypothetical protein
MKDLSLHLLDIACNSVSAGAGALNLELEEREGLLTVTITDDGAGMPPRLLAAVTDPFTTTRTTRKVGLGLPLLRLAAEQTGGSLRVESREGAGTKVTAVFDARHIDCPPLGDMAGTVAMIIQGAPHVEVRYTHTAPSGTICFDTRDIRGILGPDVPLSEPEVARWIQAYIEELTGQLHI